MQKKDNFFRSTRNDKFLFTFQDALTNLCCPKGGLFVPQELPFLTKQEIRDIGTQGLPAMSAFIISQFTSSEKKFTQSIKKILQVAYSKFKFNETHDIPLEKISSNAFVVKGNIGNTNHISDFSSVVLFTLFKVILDPDKQYNLINADCLNQCISSSFFSQHLKNINIQNLVPDKITESTSNQIKNIINSNKVSFFSSKNASMLDIETIFKDILYNNNINNKFDLISGSYFNIFSIIGLIPIFFNIYSQIKYKKYKIFINSSNISVLLAAIYARSMGVEIEHIYISTFALNDNINSTILDNTIFNKEPQKTIVQDSDIFYNKNFERLLYIIYQGDIDKIDKITHDINQLKESFVDSANISEFITAVNIARNEDIEKIIKNQYTTNQINLSTMGALNVACYDKIVKEKYNNNIGLVPMFCLEESTHFKESKLHSYVIKKQINLEKNYLHNKTDPISSIKLFNNISTSVIEDYQSESINYNNLDNLYDLVLKKLLNTLDL